MSKNKEFWYFLMGFTSFFWPQTRFLASQRGLPEGPPRGVSQKGLPEGPDSYMTGLDSYLTGLDSYLTGLDSYMTG